MLEHGIPVVFLKFPGPTFSSDLDDSMMCPMFFLGNHTDSSTCHIKRSGPSCDFQYVRQVFSHHGCLE